MLYFLNLLAREIKKQAFKGKLENFSRKMKADRK